MKTKVSFVRYYGGYTGGHQKVRDYIEHFLNLGFAPALFLSGEASTNKTLFDDIPGVEYQPSYKPHEADIIFLAGTDWQYYTTREPIQKPVFNLIQHVRHAERDTPLFKFLKEPAIRLCVSKSVTNAISPFANGPCHTIKMGHKLKNISLKPERDIYILANKQPKIGEALAMWAGKLGYATLLHSEVREKEEVIQAMASSYLTVALPHETEGFYLPGIEAMYYSRAAVVPYCVANMEYYSKHANIMIPDYTIDSIKHAILKTFELSRWSSISRSLIGKRIAAGYTAETERKQLARVLSKYL